MCTIDSVSFHATKAEEWVLDMAHDQDVDPDVIAWDIYKAYAEMEIEDPKLRAEFLRCTLGVGIEDD